MLSKTVSRITILTVISFFVILQTNAQDSTKFYLHVGAGLAFRLPGDFTTEITERSNGVKSTTVKPFSYGKGASLNVGGGYFLNKNLGLEMNLGYHNGFSETMRNVWFSNNIETKQTIETSANYFYINPGFIFRIPGEKVSYVSGLGFIKGWGNGKSDIIESYSGGGSGKFQWKYHGGSVTGVNGYAGVELPVDKNVTISFILNFQAAGGTFKEGKKTVHEFNRKNYLNTLSEHDKHILYKKYVNASTTSNPNNPKEEIQYKSGFNSA